MREWYLIWNHSSEKRRKTRAVTGSGRVGTRGSEPGWNFFAVHASSSPEVRRRQKQRETPAHGVGSGEQGFVFVVLSDLRRGRRGLNQCWRVCGLKKMVHIADAPILLEKNALNQFSNSFPQPCRKIMFLAQLLETSHRTLLAHVAKRMQKLLHLIREKSSLLHSFTRD